MDAEKGKLGPIAVTLTREMRFESQYEQGVPVEVKDEWGELVAQISTWLAERGYRVALQSFTVALNTLSANIVARPR